VLTVSHGSRAADVSWVNIVVFTVLNPLRPGYILMQCGNPVGSARRHPARAQLGMSLTLLIP
jgi:hypothetical protein